MQRIGSRACAKTVAYSEWVWTIAPIDAKARYSSRCVAVSDEGRSDPPTTAPLSSDTTTIWSGVSVPYSTPLGLIAIRPAARSAVETLPKVPSTSPVPGSARFAAHAASRSSRIGMTGSFLDRQQAFHHRRKVGACAGDAAEGIVQLTIDRVELIVGPARGRIRVETPLLQRRHATLRVGPCVVAARGRARRYGGRHGRPERGRLGRAGDQHRLADHVRVDLHEQRVLLGDAAAAHNPLDRDAVLAQPLDDRTRAEGRGFDQRAVDLGAGS